MRMVRGVVMVVFLSSFYGSCCPLPGLKMIAQSYMDQKKILSCMPSGQGSFQDSRQINDTAIIMTLKIRPTLSAHGPGAGWCVWYDTAIINDSKQKK
jgi:hypothetical protein